MDVVYGQLIKQDGCLPKVRCNSSYMSLQENCTNVWTAPSKLPSASTNPPHFCPWCSLWWHMRSLLVGRTYRHKRQCQPNSSEHRGGHGAPLVGVAQAGVPTVETPLVGTDRGPLQNQAGQRCYTHKYGGMYEPTPALAADPPPQM